mgnify:CR=1 FL=1
MFKLAVVSEVIEALDSYDYACIRIQENLWSGQVGDLIEVTHGKAKNEVKVLSIHKDNDPGYLLVTVKKLTGFMRSAT